MKGCWFRWLFGGSEPHIQLDDGAHLHFFVSMLLTVGVWALWRECDDRIWLLPSEFWLKVKSGPIHSIIYCLFFFVVRWCLTMFFLLQRLGWLIHIMCWFSNKITTFCFCLSVLLCHTHTCALFYLQPSITPLWTGVCWMLCGSCGMLCRFFAAVQQAALCCCLCLSPALSLSPLCMHSFLCTLFWSSGTIPDSFAVWKKKRAPKLPSHSSHLANSALCCLPWHLHSIFKISMMTF